MCMHLCILCVYIKLSHVCIKLGMYSSVFFLHILLACLLACCLFCLLRRACSFLFNHTLRKLAPAIYKEFLKNFLLKNLDIFLIFAQNIDCGYTLEPPRRGGSNEYAQSMFCSKNKKNRFTPGLRTPVFLYKSGV